jgi:hypothetical protein
VQHLFGLVCRDYAALLDLAEKQGFKLIEDCAHATGARYLGQRVGTRGDAAFYSSEHSKAFDTIMGGIAIARDEGATNRLEEHARSLPPTDEATARAHLSTLILEYRQYKYPHRWWKAEIARAASADAPESLTDEEKRGEKPAHYGRRLATPPVAVRRRSEARRYNGATSPDRRAGIRGATRTATTSRR